MLLGAMGAGAYAAPVVLLNQATKRAAECLADYRDPRGPEPPSCEGIRADFDLPKKAPWTEVVATQRVEELDARIPIAAYVDASVGGPNRQTRMATVAAVTAAEADVNKGSKRLVLEELGPSVTAPDLGNLAMTMGDRALLMERYEQWGMWYVRVAALEAAMLEGDWDLAQKMASRYAEWDPRESELRTTIAAVLCLGDDPKRGVDLLRRVPEDRAGSRSANMARHWGEVWIVLQACAARAGVAPPPMPIARSAGVADAVEARTAMDLRLAFPTGERDSSSDGAPNKGDKEAPSPPGRDALAAAVVLLEGKPAPEGDGLVPEARGSRAALLAGVVAYSDDLSAEAILRWATIANRERELPLAETDLLTVMDVLVQPRSLHHPAIPEVAFEPAIKRIDKLADSSNSANAKSLRQVSAALRWERATTFARAGNAELAADEYNAAAGALSLHPVQVQLVRAIAFQLSGTPQRALAILNAAPPPLEDDRPDPGPPTKALEAALLLQRASTLAALGQAEDADKAIRQADTLARETDDLGLISYVQWTRLWLVHDVSAGMIEPADDISERLLIPPYAGYADMAARWTDSDGATATRTLTVWQHALEASPREQLSVRYAVLERGGDAPRALVPYLGVATRLLGVDTPQQAAEAGDGVEVWLDAFSRIDAHRFTLRTVAWSRAEAARVRGDGAAADMWQKRYQALVEIISDPARTEIARFAGL